ncbi:unnamed protein product [Diabrotica balteata]|uniref:Uncharacterized protein n=1 Tax=Diabrotica balteata TaxID=107213 RepID=A0A9N9XID7_DIABA|nr:unnamed protein product [Diabrotica balteata]
MSSGSDYNPVSDESSGSDYNLVSDEDNLYDSDELLECLQTYNQLKPSATPRRKSNSSLKTDEYQSSSHGNNNQTNDVDLLEVSKDNISQQTSDCLGIVPVLCNDSTNLNQYIEDIMNAKFVYMDRNTSLEKEVNSSADSEIMNVNSLFAETSDVYSNIIQTSPNTNNIDNAENKTEQKKLRKSEKLADSSNCHSTNITEALDSGNSPSTSEMQERSAITKATTYRIGENTSLEEKVQLLRNDINNAPSHVFGEHNLCKTIIYFKCEGQDTNIIPVMKECGIYEDVMSALQRVIDNASSLIMNMDNNLAEHYNSVVCKFIGVDYTSQFLKISLKPVVIYSDGCNYQNRNSVLSNAILHLSMNSGVTIIHKYLEVGHTYTEGDSVNSHIEATFEDLDVLLPSQFVALLEVARKKTQQVDPYRAQQVDFEFFKDFNASIIYPSIRPGKKPGDPTVTDLRILQYRPEGKIYYKLKYTDEFASLSVRPQKQDPAIFPQALQKASEYNFGQMEKSSITKAHDE